MKGKKTDISVEENSEELQKRIGLKLKRIRKELGYNNADDFAYDKGINRSQYGKYEAGSQDIRLSSLVRIINSMGLTFEQFFSDKLD
jgi:transcriptional regulator with XRE-family HTH domain